MAWTDDQQWEKDWHGNCANSLYEEEKQMLYAEKMGLKLAPTNKTPYHFDLKNISVLDIGGGPYSLLLKCTNISRGVIVDPCLYPDWVYERYNHLNIESIINAGENIDKEKYILDFVFDEVWIYNVLQHTQNPKKIISNVCNISKLIRIFEWIDTPPTPGHPQELKESLLNEWLSGYGKTEILNERPCFGKCYYGIFKGKHYE